jgi:Kef-type K+ transport system membrane component KefB/mannitol/fructose-specific phosphotransferase system IIA component (Ntr-type)
MEYTKMIEVLSEKNILIFLLQFALLLGSARVLGIVFYKLKQPTITADIIVGLVFGPTILGRAFPQIQKMIFPTEITQMAMLETLAWIGILFLLMDTGLEVNFSSVWKQRKSAVKISIADIIIPIVISAAFIYFIPDKYIIIPERKIIFTIFLATIMTISAMPVTIRVLHELKLLKTDLGFLIISVLSINDILGWVVFTIVLGVFSKSSFEWGFAFQIFFLTITFVITAIVVLKKPIDKSVKFIKKKYPEDTGLTVTFIAVIGLLFGSITQSIGIHALFGFFIAGLVIGESSAITERDRNVFSKMVYAIFVPIFFASIGLRMDFLANFDLFLTLFITIIGVASRYGAAYFGAVISGTEKSARNIIAIAHTPGGEMHIVIGMLALHLGLINEVMFVAIVGSAVLSSILLGPWLGYSYNKIKKSKVFDWKDNLKIIINREKITREEILIKMCKEAADLSGKEEKVIVEEVVKREMRMTTAIDKGIAIPHAKIEGLEKNIVIFAKSNHGIEWNSVDGLEVNMVFLILTPLGTEEKHLAILSSIVRFVMNDDNRKGIININEEDGILKFVTSR